MNSRASQLPTPDPGRAGRNKAFLPYARQEISEQDVSAVAAALREPMITQGKGIDAFEHAVAAYLGVRHAVAVSSGTAALHAAVHAIGLGPGDELAVPAITFAASANCALYERAHPRFVDVDSASGNIDTASLAERLTSRTKAVMAVSFAGLPVSIDEIRRCAPTLPVIEDACHALGGRRGGRPVGAPGGADITVFSLHPAKAITTGEGGLAVTEDDELARRMRMFRTHGIVREGITPGPTDGEWYYEMQDLGFNYRITDVQCALGRSQLARLDGWVGARNEIAARYRELLADEDRLRLPPDAHGDDLHAYHLFVAQVRAGLAARHRVFQGLRMAQIGTQVHYIPVYRLPYYRDDLGYAQDECPGAESYYSGCLSLPMFPSLDDADLRRVVSELRLLL